VSATEKLRTLPAVNEVLDRLAGPPARFPRPLVLQEVRRAIETARREILQGRADDHDIASRVERALEQIETPSLRRVINATGVVLHTNLGRAPLGAVTAVPGYSNLEYDLSAAGRGTRVTLP
jgi:L-seryl-tRNA(Ser) seleniumtransferase